jgi:uncharacterized protein YbaP (TraB family)
MYYEVKNSNLRIAGSMHVFPADSPKMPSWILEAYGWCEHLVIESDPMTILPHLQLPEGRSLEERLPSDVWRELLALWPSAIPLAPLKPWAVAFSLPHILLPLVPGVDLYLIERAKSDTKPISTLETGAEVAHLLDAVPDSVYAEALAFMVRNPDFIRNHIHSLHTAWLRRDLASVFAVISQSPLWQFPILREAIVGARNRAWIPVIRKAVPSKQRKLILVGALHLCGEGNVTELYEKKEGHVLSILP